MSLIGDFARTVAARPKKIALIAEKSQLTFEDLQNLILAFDIELTTRGVRPGQTLVLDSKRAEFCLAMAILLNLRSYTVIFAPVAAVLGAKLEVDRYLVTTPNPQLPEDRQIIIEPDWFSTLGTIAAPDYTAHDNDGGAAVFMSSGSTGIAKFIQRKMAHRKFEGILRNDQIGLEHRRLASTVGPSTAAGQKYLLGALLAGGSCLTLGESKDNLLPYVDLYRVDTLCTSPAVIHMVLDLPDAGQYLTSLREVTLIGAPTGPDLLRGLSKLCPAELNVAFGATEIGSLFHHSYDPKAGYVFGQVGKFMREDLEIGFYDEAGKPLVNATEGIVGFRPKDASVQNTYLSGGDDPQTGFKNGVFFSGDIMRREGDQYFLIGRTKNIVNFSGNKVSLDLVRDVLQAAFAGSTIVPLVVSDANGLERLAVFVKAQISLSPEQLNVPLEARFKGIDVVKAIAVDTFPLTASGKIDTQALRQRLDPA